MDTGQTVSKPVVLYRGPFATPGFFETLGRKEAAGILCQWRRNGMVKRVASRPRGYKLRGPDGETARLEVRIQDEIG